MQAIRNAIPNLLTLGNLACGLVAITILFDRPFVQGSAAMVAWLMFGAMACDFLDGFAARALKATSNIGKELDSLSDLVSFGVLPGMMVFTMLQAQVQSLPEVAGFHVTILPWYLVAWPYLAFVIPLLSALRLAKFNVDTRQSYGFLGLPTPANALFFLSIFMIWGYDGLAFKTTITTLIPEEAMAQGLAARPSWAAELTYGALGWLHNPYVLSGLSILFSVLLVTEIPLLAMKFKDYRFQNNWPRYVLILVSLPLLAVFWFRAIPLIIVLYFVFSFIDSRIHRNTA